MAETAESQSQEPLRLGGEGSLADMAAGQLLQLVTDDGRVMMADQKTVWRLVTRDMLEACKGGKCSALGELLEAGLDRDTKNASGRTGLHYAAREGHLKVCQMLLAAKATVDARNRWQETPLHAAAYNARPDVAALLLEAGADARAPNDQGKTPLDYARMAAARGKFKKGCEQVVQLLAAAAKKAAELPAVGLESHAAESSGSVSNDANVK